ncbi:32885_t:CDS:2, partial [Racocetra persica]
QTILMGAKTFASIAENLTFASNLKEVLKPYQKNPTKHIFVIGGREIYRQTYTMADYYYVSLVKGIYEGN